MMSQSRGPCRAEQDPGDDRDAKEFFEWSVSLVCRSCRFLRLRLWRFPPRSHIYSSPRNRFVPREPDGPAHPDLWEVGQDVDVPVGVQLSGLSAVNC